MSFSEHATHFAGMPVKDFHSSSPLEEPTHTAYRLRANDEDRFGGASAGRPGLLAGLFGRGTVEPAVAPARGLPGELGRLLADPRARELRALVIGAWMESDDLSDDPAKVIAALVAAREQLPGLEAVFLGDIISEECEVSWLHQSDLAPLLHAYPNLRHLQVRGNDGLKFGPVHHANLRKLVIQTGGLSREVVTQVFASELPALEHLELWLGTENYGGDVTIVDLEPLLSGRLFPSLHTLALRNSEISDELAAALVKAPVLEQIRVLDLSLGTLTDAGAAALLDDPDIRELERLDLHRHFLSDEMMARLQTLPIPVDVSEQESPDEYDGKIYRYCAVTE